MENSEFALALSSIKIAILKKENSCRRFGSCLKFHVSCVIFDSRAPYNPVSGIVISNGSRIAFCVIQHGFKKVFKSVLAELFEGLDIECGTIFVDSDDQSTRVAHDSEWPNSAFKRAIFTWQDATGTGIKQRTISNFIRIFCLKIEIK